MENANANCNNSEDGSPEGSPSEGAGSTANKTCYGCKSPIRDEFSLHVTPDLEWHVACLQCTECQQPLDESCTCFMKDGQPYCRKDYVRLTRIKCSTCSQSIEACDYVMRAKGQVYHIDCFQCCACEKQLLAGVEFGLYNGKLFCKADFDALPADSLSLQSPKDTENCNGNSSSSSSSTASSTSSGTTTKRSNSEKGPRVRTVLSEQQLQTLRTVYSSNPRPDALLKEHLVEITGLNPRVIRVWFQNKRCKDKKRVIHAEAARIQQQQVLQQATTPLMPPLTPQTPLTPDSMGQISPHPGISAFTYPPAASGYDSLGQPSVAGGSQPGGLPTTPTSVSPIITYQHNPAWGSPTDTMAHFDTTSDFSSPISTEHQQQTFIYSTASSVQPNHFAF